MRIGVLWMAMATLGCGALTPPGADGGADSGTQGAWVELSLPAEASGPIAAMNAYPGAVFALSGENTVLHSSGGNFDWVTTYESPVVLYLASTQSGHVAYTAFQTLFACSSDCANSNSYDNPPLPRTPVAVCGGDDQLAVLTTATDAGAAVLMELDGGWAPSQPLDVATPKGCARSGDSVFITTQGGVFNSFTRAVERITVPGRDGSIEPWRFAGTAGTAVFVTSDLGAVARRDALGVWSATQITGSVIDALTVESDESAWVAVGNSLFHLEGSVWAPAGAGPSVLTGITGVAAQPTAIYVGGVDAAGRPRIFRRQR